MCGRTLIRKTSLLRKINPMMRRSSFTKKIIYNSHAPQTLICRTHERRNDLEIMSETYKLLCRSQTRIDLLFTMSEIPHADPVKDRTCEVMFRGRYERAISSISDQPSGGARRDRTDDLMLAKHALYQLSYGPVKGIRLSRALSFVPLVCIFQVNGRPGQTRTADLTLIRRAL